MIDRFRLISLLVIAFVISGCVSPISNPDPPTLPPPPNPTQESTPIDTPAPSTTPSPTATIGPTPALVPMDEIEAVCSAIHGTEMIQLSEGSSLDVLLNAGASSCYKVAAIRARIENPTIKSGLWNHISHQGVDPFERLPAVSVYFDQDFDFQSLEKFFTPTPTPLSLSTGAFKVEVIGQDEHGAMLELSYDGDSSKLTDLEIKTSLYQYGLLKEESVFYKEGDRLFAEITDAVYDLGELVVILQFPQKLDTLGDSRIEFKIEYDQLFPWMVYTYGDSGLADQFIYPWETTYEHAWVQQPVSDEYPDGLGYKVTSPCVGTVIQAGRGSAQERSLWVFCEYTGYFVELGHIDDAVNEDTPVDENTLVGYINAESGWPHNRISLLRSNDAMEDFHQCLLEILDYVDIFNPHVQLGGETLLYGFWLEDSLPESMREAIEKGVFTWNE